MSPGGGPPAGLRAVWLLAATDLCSLSHAARRRAFLAIPYAIFVIFFYAIVRGALPSAPGALARVEPGLVVGLLYHLVLAMAVLEGALGGIRLFVRSDLDTLHALPLSNRARFLSRFLVEVAVEAASFTPLVAAFALAVAPSSLSIVLPFLVLFWGFHLAAEAVRHLVDLALDRLLPGRSRHLSAARRLVLAAGIGLLLLPMYLRSRGVLVLPAVAEAVGALNAQALVPSSAAAAATLDLFAGDAGGFVGGLGVVLGEGALAVAACVLLAERGFDFEFIRLRTQSMLRFVHAPWGPGVGLPSRFRTSAFAELVHKDLLVLSRSHLYQMQLVVPFVVFSGLLVANAVHFDIFSRFTAPVVNLYIATFIQFMAIWFLFVPASEFCFAIEERQEWIMRMLPLARGDVVRSRFAAILAYNGGLAFVLSLAIVLTTLGASRPDYALLALMVGAANILYSAAMAILVNLVSPAYVSRFMANPLATVLYVAQYFLVLAAFSAASALLIRHVPLLAWVSVMFLVAGAVVALRLSARLLERMDAV